MANNKLQKKHRGDPFLPNLKNIFSKQRTLFNNLN